MSGTGGATARSSRDGKKLVEPPATPPPKPKPKGEDTSPTSDKGDSGPPPRPPSEGAGGGDGRPWRNNTGRPPLRDSREK